MEPSKPGRSGFAPHAGRSRRSSSSSDANQQDRHEAAALHDMEAAAFAPLGPSLYEYKNRPYRDLWAAGTFLIWLVGTVLGSFVAFGLTDSAAIQGKYSVQFYQNSTSCSFDTFKVTPLGSSSSAISTFGSSFAVSMGIWLPVSLIVGVIISIAYLWAFKNHALKMVYASFIGSAALCLAMGIVLFGQGAVGGGIILLILSLVYIGIMWLCRGQLQLVGKLFSIAGRGLQACPAILTSTICIKLAGVGLLVFLFVGAVCAGFVGKVAPNPVRTYVSDGPNGYCLGTVMDAQGRTSPSYVDCCVYETSGWGAAHIFFAVVCMSWTAQVLLQLKLYVVADTLAQWYFQPAGSSPEPYLQPSAMRAVRHGLTSSFGSVCFSGLILMIIEMLRKAMNNAQNNAEGWMKLVCCILNCVAQCLLDILEQFTRFATIACAITGQAFVPAAKDMFHLLKRNFLATYSLWWIPDFVLGMSCLLLSLAWTGIVYGATYAQWKGSLGGDAVGVAAAVSGMAFFAFGFILYFLASVMLDAVNSVYICFSLDRDRKVITMPEVHDVYLALPALQGAGAVIEQPDGAVAYGAASHHAPPSQHIPGGYSLVAMTAVPPQPTYPGAYYPHAHAAPPPPPYSVAASFPAATPAYYPAAAQQPYPAYSPYGQYPAGGYAAVQPADPASQPVPAYPPAQQPPDSGAAVGHPAYPQIR